MDSGVMGSIVRFVLAVYVTYGLTLGLDVGSFSRRGKLLYLSLWPWGMPAVRLLETLYAAWGRWFGKLVGGSLMLVIYLTLAWLLYDLIPCDSVGIKRFVAYPAAVFIILGWAGYCSWTRGRRMHE